MKNKAIFTPAIKPVGHTTIVLDWATVRSARSLMLSRTDWTQMPDSPLTATQKTAWQTYRQALRDITKQTDPTNIIWPTPPGAI